MDAIKPTHTLRARLRVLEWATAGGVSGAYAAEIKGTQSLHAYATHSLATHQRLVLAAENLSTHGTHVFELALELDVTRARSASVRADGARATRFPASAQLKFMAFVESATETGLPCRVDLGVASFLFTDLLAAAHNEPVVRRIWQRTGDKPLVKGLLQLTNVELVRLGDGAPAEFEPASDNEWFPADAGTPEARARYTRLQQRVDTWIERSLESTFARVLRARACEALKNAHCPLYTRDVGRIFAGAYLLHLPRDTAAAGVYRASLTAACRCADVSPEFLVDVMRAQLRTPARLLGATPRALEVFANALSAATHAMVVYENDFVNDPDTPAAGAAVSEDFKDGELEDGDDCEDSGKTIYVRARFQRVRFDRTNATDEALTLFQRALFDEHWYKFGLVLPAIVTNKQADVRAIVDPNEVQAHTYAVALPYAAVLGRLAGGGDADTEAAVARVRACPEARAAAAAHMPFHDELPVLVLEGTAPANSLPLPIAAYYAAKNTERALAAIVRARSEARAALAPAMPAAVQMDASQSTLEYTAAMARGDEDVSAFYKYVCSIAVDFREAGVLQLAAATLRDDGVLSHGATWSEFVRSDRGSRLRLVPEYALDARQRAVVDDFLEQLEEVPALVRDDQRAAHVELAGAPAALLEGLRELFGPERVYVGAALAEQHAATNVDVDTMPLPAALVPLRARARDLTTGAVRAMLAAVRAQQHRFTHVRVATVYMADAPVPGETQLRDIVEHEILLYLRT